MAFFKLFIKKFLIGIAQGLGIAAGLGGLAIFGFFF